MDFSHLDPSKFYLVSGKTLSDIKEKQDRLWAGDMIQRGPGIFRRGSGSGGFTLAATAASPIASPPPSITPHNYTVVDASHLTPGNPSISVVPGNHLDSTGGSSWTPTLGGTPIAPTIPRPHLIISSSATVAYFNATVKPTDGSGSSPAGAFTALEIDADSGFSGLPENTLTNIYQICAYLIVSGPDGAGNYTVSSNEGGVGGSQVYQFCGGPLFGLQ